MLSVAVRYTPRLSTAEQQLIALPSRLRNLAPLMTQAVAPAAIAMLQQHWQSKGAAFGHPWAPWASATLAQRTRKGNVGQGILRDTNSLFDALFSSIASGDRLRAVPGGLRLSLGVDDPIERAKALFHQLGTSRMPARQVIPSPLPRSFRDLVRSLAHDFIATGRVRGAGGRFVSAGVS